VVLARAGVDAAAGERGRTEDEREHGGEAGDAGRERHATTCSGAGAWAWWDVYSAGRSSIAPSMQASIATCSTAIRRPVSSTIPAHSTATTASVGRTIEVAISPFARQPCPR
jgi:hypothetical protein